MYHSHNKKMCDTFVLEEEYLNVSHSNDIHDIENIPIISSETFEQILISWKNYWRGIFTLYKKHLHEKTLHIIRVYLMFEDE